MRLLFNCGFPDDDYGQHSAVAVMERTGKTNAWPTTDPAADYVGRHRDEYSDLTGRFYCPTHPDRPCS